MIMTSSLSRAIVNGCNNTCLKSYVGLVFVLMTCSDKETFRKSYNV